MVNPVSGRKLWRIPEKGIVKGVCAGIAQYLDVPVVLVRAITVLSLFFGFFLFVLLAYIVMTFVLDPMPGGADEKNRSRSTRDSLKAVEAQLAAGEQRLRSMERYITSDTFTLRSRFRQL